MISSREIIHNEKRKSLLKPQGTRLFKVWAKKKEVLTNEIRKTAKGKPNKSK